MTPKSWTDYAAAALAREQEPICDRVASISPLQTDVTGDQYYELHRCSLRAGHEGAHR